MDDRRPALGSDRRPADGRLVAASVLVGVLVAFASLLGLFADWPYARETENWVLQARGQDLGNLLAVPVLVVAAFRMRAGSARATQVWFGALFYFLYAYLVYAFAVHFSRLFLVYVAVLGLVFFTLVVTLVTRGMPVAHPRDGARAFAAWVLIATGVLFGLLWLSELIPSTVSGEAPPGLEVAGLIVNPIHVIDLSVVLPGMIVIGVLALRRSERGVSLTAPALVFSVLMGSSIIAAMVLVVGSGDPSGLVPMAMVALVVVTSLIGVVMVMRGATVQAGGRDARDATESSTRA